MVVFWLPEFMMVKNFQKKIACILICVIYYVNTAREDLQVINYKSKDITQLLQVDIVATFYRNTCTALQQAIVRTLFCRNT